MPRKKNRIKKESESLDYESILKRFKDSNDLAFIPEQQQDIHRYNWHTFAENMGLVTHTVKLWVRIGLCGRHNKPIIGPKPNRDEYDRLYESDYECDYECDSEEEFEEHDEYGCIYNCCFLDDEYVENKMRTVVIFGQNSGILKKDKDVKEIKKYLLKNDIIEIKNERYCVK